MRMKRIDTEARRCPRPDEDEEPTRDSSNNYLTLRSEVEIDEKKRAKVCFRFVVRARG